MVDSSQGGRSSRPPSTSKEKLRAKLRTLDRKCQLAKHQMRTLGVYAYLIAEGAERAYQKADMERMVVRNKIKAYKGEKK